MLRMILIVGLAVFFMPSLAGADEEIECEVEVQEDGFVEVEYENELTDAECTVAFGPAGPSAEDLPCIELCRALLPAQDGGGGAVFVPSSDDDTDSDSDEVECEVEVHDDGFTELEYENDLADFECQAVFGPGVMSSVGDLQCLELCRALLPAQDVPENRRVFVSSTTHAGNFGVVGGALAGDTICQSLADAASLGGTWMAWLSDSTTSPSTRFTQSTVPYELIDGTTIANDWADLTDGAIQNSINRDESNMPVVGIVWTATQPDGTPTLPIDFFASCEDWTSVTTGGDPGRTDVPGANFPDGFWSFIDLNPNLATDCSMAIHLYCFEQ